METLLRLDSVDAGYGRVKILSDLSFEVKKGEVFGVIGPNGCGKTTMFNALLGHIIPTKGTITFNGTDITKCSPNQRCRMGIGRTYQVPRPFPSMSIYENVLVSAVYGGNHTERSAHPVVMDVLKQTGLYDKRDVIAGTLTLLDLKRLEIARAMGSEPSLLLLDEVAAGLTDGEVHDVMDLVASLRERGQTIIWIEHIIQTMVNSTDRLMCMSAGTNLLIGEPHEVMNSQLVQDVYLGSEEDDDDE